MKGKWLGSLIQRVAEGSISLREPELGGKSPYDAIMKEPPYGLRDVVRLLGRMTEGIPT